MLTTTEVKDINLRNYYKNARYDFGRSPGNLIRYFRKNKRAHYALCTMINTLGYHYDLDLKQKAKE